MLPNTPWEDVSLPDSAVRRRMRLNTDAGKHRIEMQTEQDCTELLSLNTAMKNADNSSGSLWDGRSMVKVAEIPLALLEKWRTEEGIDFLRWNDEDKARLMRKIRDPDVGEFSKLRTSPGRI